MFQLDYSYVLIVWKNCCRNWTEKCKSKKSIRKGERGLLHPGDMDQSLHIHGGSNIIPGFQECHHRLTDGRSWCTKKECILVRLVLTYPLSILHLMVSWRLERLVPTYRLSIVHRKVSCLLYRSILINSRDNGNISIGQSMPIE